MRKLETLLLASILLSGSTYVNAQDERSTFRQQTNTFRYDPFVDESGGTTWVKREFNQQNFYYDARGNKTMSVIHAISIPLGVENPARKATPRSRVTFLYDENNRIRTSNEYNYDSFTRSWSFYSQYIYTYHDNGKLLKEEYFRIDASGPEKKSYTEYVYTPEGWLEKTSVYTAEYNNPGTFNRSEENIYSEFTPDGKPGLIEQYTLKNKQLTNTRNTYNTYDSDNRLVFTQNKAVLENGELDERYSAAYVYDEQGRLSEQTTRTYNMETTMMEPQYKIIYTYDNETGLLIKTEKKGAIFQLSHPDEVEYTSYQDSVYTNIKNYRKEHAPLSLTGQDGENQGEIRLSWEAPAETSGLDGYLVFCDGLPVNETPILACAYTLTGLSNGDHEFTVQSIFGGQEANICNPITLTVTDPKCKAPANLRSPKNEWNEIWHRFDVTLEWDAPVTDYQVVRYEIYRDGKNVASTSADSEGNVPCTKVDDFSTDPDTPSAVYQVQAIYNEGNSPLSEPLTVMLDNGEGLEQTGNPICSVVYHPSLQKIFFSEAADAILYGTNGKIEGRCTKSKNIDVSGLQGGIYLLSGKTENGKEISVKIRIQD